MKALIQSATQPQRNAGRENIEEWLQYGYVAQWKHTDPLQSSSLICVIALHRYVSYASNHKAAILTLEYAFDGTHGCCDVRHRQTPATHSRIACVAYLDWAVANMAAALNNSAAAQLFYNRSKNYQNVWNADEQFFCPKSRDSTANGAVTWACPPWYDYLNPFDTRYEEGDAWHWR
jgi:hypothetical protein